MLCPLRCSGMSRGWHAGQPLPCGRSDGDPRLGSALPSGNQAGRGGARGHFSVAGERSQDGDHGATCGSVDRSDLDRDCGGAEPSPRGL